MTTQLAEPVYTADSVRSVNFFNGRLLSAEDLTQEQTANRVERHRLGLALGDGIAYGLEVTKPGNSTNAAQSPTLIITPGIAVNREGQTLAVNNRIELSVSETSSNTTSSSTAIATFGGCCDDDFIDCADETPFVPSQADGFYLLTIFPVEGREGRALTSGLGNVDAQCNTKYLVEGLEFRLIKMALTQSPSSPDFLRNFAAYDCFGMFDQAYQSLPKNLFGDAVSAYGLIDQLRQDSSVNGLQLCEVPLAVLHWQSGFGLDFIDMWAARRRISAPVSASRWPLLMSERRRAEGEAMFMQFQQQIDDLRLDPSVSKATFQANKTFRYLPAAGLVPVSDGTWLPGFDTSHFFQDIATRPPVTIDGGLLSPVLKMSFDYSPLDLGAKPPLFLYKIAQNQAVNGTYAAQPYLLFTSALLPDLGVARYDVSQFDSGVYV